MKDNHLSKIYQLFDKKNIKFLYIIKKTICSYEQRGQGNDYEERRKSKSYLQGWFTKLKKWHYKKNV